MGRVQLVLGPPGTGKTTWTSRQITRAREKHGNRLLVCSFTRAAAAELLGRNLELPDDRVGTLHAICYRALGRPELADKHVKEFTAETGIPVGSNNPDAGIGFILDDPLQVADTLRSKQVPVEAWPTKIQAFWKKWQTWKTHNGLMDFADLIETAYHDFEKAPGDPRVIFYDEAQDGSVLDLELINKWAQHADHAIVVGDEDQTLYRFRGANPERFLAFGDDHDPIILSQSYRLPRAVHAFAIEWITKHVSKRAVKAYKPRAEEGEAWVRNDISIDQHWNLLPEIEKDLEAGLSVMLLTRTNKQIGKVISALREAHYPFHNPYSKKNGRWNPLARSSHRITAAQRIANWADVPWTWEQVWSFIKITDATSIAGKKREVEFKSKTMPDTIATPGEIEAILGPQWLDAIDDEDHDFLVKATLVKKRNPILYPVEILKLRGRDALLDEPRIVVGTIHSVKGGQADSVYLFPDLSGFDRESLMGLNGIDQKEDIYRVFYVGMTRARYKLTLCGPPYKGDFIRWHGSS